jgi:FkbM family methyltransferase
MKDFIERVNGRKLCLQAGGAHGVYPLELAKCFDKVVTVEADKDNFAVLCKATADIKNIECVHAGLWHETGRGKMKCFRPGKSLTSYVIPGDEVELITIDSLNLRPDLTWLDIEGSEFKALSGAQKTLETCKSVIIEEGKGLEKNVGDKAFAARDLLQSLGFRNIYRNHLDTLYQR